MMCVCKTFLEKKPTDTAENRLKIPDLDTISAVCRALAVRGLRMCTPQGDG